MSLEIATGLNLPEEERLARVRGNRTETDGNGYWQTIRPWDEIAQKWPRERFPSLLSMDYRA